MTKTRLIRIAILSLVALVIAAGVAYWQVSAELAARQAAAPDGEYASSYAAAGVGGPFELVDHTGETVTREDFAGQYLMIYFGYTYCPDVCPTELYEMVTAFDMLGEDGEAVQPVFVSVDPERDTVERMADYVALYHPELIGLTGSDEQIEDVAEGYRVFYRRVDSPDFAEYLMDHSSQIYFVGPNGQMLDMFSPTMAPEEMAERVRGWLHRAV